MDLRRALLTAMLLAAPGAPAAGQGAPTAGQGAPTAAQVKPLTIGTEFQGQLPGPSEFPVQLTAGQAYRFRLESDAFDPMLELVDPDGQRLAEDDDGGGGLNAQIVHVAGVSGVHRVRVRANELGNSGGNFTLLVVGTQAPRPPEAQPLQLGEAIEGALGGPGEPRVRVYRLRLAQGQILSATMDAASDAGPAAASKGPARTPDRRNAPGDLDPLLELRRATDSPEASPLARDDDGGEGLNARLTWRATQAGDYHLYARAVGSSAGRFRLRADVVQMRPKAIADLVPGREERHALTAATASPGSADGQPFHAYRLRGAPGQAFVIDLRSAAFDALLEVVGDSILGRRPIARDDDGGDQTNARLEIRFERAGDVEVRALSLDGDEGEYVLSVRSGTP